MIPGSARSQPTSGRFLVRMNCELSILVEAPTPVLALQMAEAIDLEKWEQAWAATEVDTED